MRFNSSEHIVNLSLLSKVCSHTWKWFDISNGKWCPYAATNNKQIDDAFWAGEQSVKIQNGRRKYSIQFGTMMQVNAMIGTQYIYRVLYIWSAINRALLYIYILFQTLFKQSHMPKMFFNV